MHAAALRAVEAAGADLVRAVSIEDGTAPFILERASQRSFDIRAQVCPQELRLELPHVALELVAAHFGQTGQIFGKAHPHVSAVAEGDVELLTTRRDDTAAGGERQDTQKIVACLVVLPGRV